MKKKYIVFKSRPGDLEKDLNWFAKEGWCLIHLQWVSSTPLVIMEKNDE